MAYRNDVLTKICINARRSNSVYKVAGFREYSVDSDMETDTDQFHIILENPKGIYSGLFNKYDGISLYVMDQEMMHGRLDDVTYICDESNNIIDIVGRDDMGILVDNDAIPCTLNNIDPVAYLKKKCQEYWLSNYYDSGGHVVPRVKSYGTVSKVSTVVIGTGESEMTVLNNMVADQHVRLWQDDCWLCIGDWQTGQTPEYYFTRGVASNKQGIPIETIRLSDSGLDVKSEVLIYGTMDDGKEKVLGTAKNPSGKFYDGIPRRMVMSSYSNDKNTKYSGSADRKVRDAFRNGISLQITINPQNLKVPVWINKTAHVVDTLLKLDATFFIKAVNYSKTLTAGSICTITMIPDDTTFNILWKNVGLTAQGAYLLSK